MAYTRTIDNFAAWVPQLDAVVFGSQSAELRSDGMFREDTSGSAYGPVSYAEGNLPRLPCSGTDGRPVEVFVKNSRGPVSNDRSVVQLPDSARDGMTAQVFYRPCWLTVPES